MKEFRYWSVLILWAILLAILSAYLSRSIGRHG